ncbi:MAG: hypothetical protein LBF16_11805, partial [Pseudomonadales bacterium]|nr:hypothetical protein [Pseudomonadales bacterium]
KVPVRAIHCTQDPVVPYGLGAALFAALGSSDERFTSVDGRCHVPNIVQLGPALRELELWVKAQR